MLRTKSSFWKLRSEEPILDAALPRWELPYLAGILPAQWFSEDATRASKAVFFMHSDGPVTRLPIGAAPGKRPGLRACLMLMLGASIACATAFGAQGPKAESGAKAAAAQAKDAAPSAYVGGDICATCHEEVSKKFADNPHTKLAAQHGAAGVNCEGCHGPGGAHVDGGGDATKIFDPAKASPKDVDRQVPELPRGSASQLRTCSSCQGRRKLHRLPQHPRQRRQGRPSQGCSAHALLSVPHRREAVVRYAVPPQGERRSGQVQRLS